MTEYFPVRHHSPACSYHLERTLERLQPQCVLIEGPENANHLLPLLARPESKAPLALYCAIRDDKGQLGEAGESYKCYYPFLDCSPELTAIRWAARSGAEARFIDLPYSRILLSCAQEERRDRPVYQDENRFSHRDFLDRLREKTGLRSFDEFWEKYFEVGGIAMETGDFLSLLRTYCAMARETDQSLAADGTLAREAYMAQNIAKAQETYERILVVTGGFHVEGLLHPAPVELPQEAFPQEQVYPMVYSMEAADALRGYASGMPSPGFYQRVWEHLHAGAPEDAYSDSVLELLTAVGRRLRHEGEALSVADETCALDMARGLAALRGKPQPGLYELRDAVQSAFVKGEITLVCPPLELLQKLTTGDQVGSLPEDAQIPPLATDFQNQCARLGLRLNTSQQQQSTLQIFSSPKHREVSRFFHRTVFLDCHFARLSKGPDLARQKNQSLIREIWDWRWSGGVMASLVDQSVTGGTVEEACTRLLNRRMAQAAQAGEGAELLVNAFLMGLEDADGSLHSRLRTLMVSDGDFFSLARACGHLNTLLEMGRLYRQTDSYDYTGLLDQCFGRVLTLLPSMASIKDEQLTPCLSLLSLLYQLSGQVSFSLRRPALLSALERMRTDPDLHPGLHGGILGLLYGADPSWREEIERTCGGYLRGTRERMLQSAAFLRGLFSTARDLVLVSEQFLPSLDELFARLEEEDFLSLLPELRLAFHYFTPMEISRIAARTAALHGVHPDRLRRSASLDYAYGEALDAWAAARI